MVTGMRLYEKESYLSFGISTLFADREQLSISILNLTLCLYFQHIKISLPVRLFANLDLIVTTPGLESQKPTFDYC